MPNPSPMFLGGGKPLPKHFIRGLKGCNGLKCLLKVQLRTISKNAGYRPTCIHDISLCSRTGEQGGDFLLLLPPASTCAAACHCLFSFPHHHRSTFPVPPPALPYLRATYLLCFPPTWRMIFQAGLTGGTGRAASRTRFSLTNAALPTNTRSSLFFSYFSAQLSLYNHILLRVCTSYELMINMS